MNLSSEDLKDKIQNCQDMMNYIMENHGYDIMDLVDEIRYEKCKYEFALKCKQE